MTRVAVVTTCRSDYGASSWVIHDLAHDPRTELLLLVGGSHLAPAHGLTVREIESDGWPISARLDFLRGDEQGAAWGEALARATQQAARALAQLQPDVVLLYGDRLELLAVAGACVATGLPLAHVCGGDVTEGALDEQVRHALSKLAHLHFPSTPASAARLRQMGEEPWRVHAVGDPALDGFVRGERAPLEELRDVLGFAPDRRTLVVAFHPPTLELPDLPRQLDELVAALHAYDGSIVITGPAPDPGGPQIREALRALAAARPRTTFVDSLGSRRYRGLLFEAGALLGNSSSALNEAPCVPLPAVDVGSRQRGRERAGNVIAASAERRALADAVARALDPAFRASLAGLRSPYGDGRAAGRIVEVLASLPARSALLHKRFVERTAPRPSVRPRAIGGDLPLSTADLASALAAPPGPPLFATARAALAAVVRAEGGGTWLVPDFICPAVPDAVRAGGGTPVPYPLDTPWRPRPEALRGLLDGARGLVVPFHLGLAPDPLFGELLAGTGLCVVEDRCHVVGAPELAFGHHAIGSYRKWLATPDGAWLRSKAASPRPQGDPDPALAELRLAAALARRWRDDLDDGEVERAAVELFRAGEERAGAAAERASRVGEALVARADLEQRPRLANQRALAQALSGSRRVRLLEPRPGALLASERPLLAVGVVAEDRDALREALSRQRVFTAVHWRNGDWSGAGGRAETWARTTLSLPIDGRLGPDDVARMAALLD